MTYVPQVLLFWVTVPVLISIHGYWMRTGYMVSNIHAGLLVGGLGPVIPLNVALFEDALPAVEVLVLAGGWMVAGVAALLLTRRWAGEKRVLPDGSEASWTRARLAWWWSAEAFFLAAVTVVGVVARSLGFSLTRRPRLVPYIRKHGGEVDIGGQHVTVGRPGTLDGYLKGCIKRTTAGWVAVLLEVAGVVEIVHERPARVRLV